MSTRVVQSPSIFPFLKLPAELRNRIYEYAVEPEPRVSLFRTSRDTTLVNEHSMRFTAEYGMSKPTVLAICKTIRHEVTSELRAERPYKIVVYAWGHDEAELFRLQARLRSLLARFETQDRDQ
jgi:hypothetical protein